VYRSRPDDLFSRRVCWDGLRTWERSTVEYIAGVSDAIRGFWDVGAHTGVYTLLVAAVNPTVHIRSFEPNPKVLPLLRENLVANRLPDGLVVPAALSDTTGVARLHVPDDVTAARVASKGVEIQTVRGDDVDDGSAVDLVKIDVEGHELAVLRGMIGLLERCRPALVIEIAGHEQVAAVRSLLAPLGYQDGDYFTGRGLIPAIDGMTWEGGHLNFLFIAPWRSFKGGAMGGLG
jgi:FkbM family methyltransferase